MATTITLNGVSYSIPATGDSNWGDATASYLIAISTTVLQKTGGAFTLTADLDFGASFGVKSTYFTSRTANAAASGAVRLASTDAIKFRNNANGADVALSKDTSDQLAWAGTSFLSASGVLLAAGFPALTGDVTTSAGALATTIAAAAVTNAKLASMAANTIKGNNTGGSATPVDLTVAQTQTMLSIPTSSVPLPLNAGGTGTSAASANAAFNALSPMTTLGDVVYGGASGAGTRLAGNTTTGKQFLNQTGTGTVSAAPAWSALASGDIPAINLAASGAGGVTGALPLSSFATIADKTVLANVSGGTAVPSAVSLVSTATASTVMYRDANANTRLNNLIENGQSVATAAGTTTLTVSSPYFTQFTGTTTQIAALPDATTLTQFQCFLIANRSTGAVTVNDGSGALVKTMAAGSQAVFTVTSIGATAGTWDVAYSATAAGTVTSVAMTVPTFLSVSGSPITGSGTLAVTLSGTALPILNGGTGQTTAAAAFNALSPMTTDGDLITRASGTNSRIGIGSSGQVLKVVGGAAAWATFSGGINYISANPDAESDTSGWVARNWQQTVTITIASPGVFTVTSTTGMYVGMPISFTTSGALPTGLTASTTYYISSVVSGTTFQVSATLGGADVNTSGSQSGTHTSYPLVQINASTVALSQLTFTRSTSSPLRGAGSFLFTQTNSQVVAGQGQAFPFTIDSADKAKALSVQCDYNASSTFVASSGQTGSDSDIEIGIWDVTNSAMIPVSPKVITANGSNNFTFKGTFQTASNSTSYELVFYTPTMNANATGWTFKFDNVYVGPQAVVFGPSAVAARASGRTGTITSGNVLTFASLDYDTHGAYSTSTSKYTAPLSGFYKVTTFVSGTSSIKFQPYQNGSLITCADGSTLTLGVTDPNGHGTFSTVVKLAAGDTLDIRPTNGTFTGDSNAGQFIEFSCLTGSTLASNDADTREVGMQATIASTLAVTSGQPIVLTSVTRDTHGAYNSGTGRYTVPVSGDYIVAISSFTVTSSSMAVQVYKNGVVVPYGNLAYPFTATSTESGLVLIPCVAGDILDVRGSASLTLGYSAGAGGYQATMSIFRLSGPSAIAASESVNASYYVSAGTQTPGAATQINFDTKIFDSHNAVTTGAGAWKFTAPAAGKYDVAATGEYSSGTAMYLDVYKNGSSYSRLTLLGASASQVINGGGVVTISLLAGDYVDVRVSAAGIIAGGTGPYHTYISLKRVGN